MNAPNPYIIVRPKQTWSPSFSPKIQRFFSFTNIAWIVGIVLVLLIAQNFDRVRHLLTRAAVGQATIAVQPANVSLPPNATMQVWITTSAPVGFARVDIEFDHEKVRLTAPPTLIAGIFGRVIQTTSVAEANNSGHIIMVVGVEPTQKSQAPQGTFEFARLSFQSLSSIPNDTTVVAAVSGESQLVDMNAVPFVLTSVPSTATLNPQAPTPTVIVASPTSTVTTPSVAAPVVIITKPQEGSKIPTQGNLGINATAQSTAGIKFFDIFFDAQLIKSCGAKTICAGSIQVKGISSGNHTITAKVIDIQDRQGTTSIFISK